MKPEKQGCIWVVEGGNGEGAGRVRTGGIWNPAVAGAQVAEAGGVGSWVGRALGSKTGDWEGVRRSSGSQAEMEGRRDWGAMEEEREVVASSQRFLEELSGAKEMGSLQRGQPSCSSCLTLSVRSWR